MVNWIFQEVDRNVIRKTRDLLEVNSQENRGGKNEGWSRRALECNADLINSWPTQQGALEQTTPIRGIPCWAELAGS